MQLPVEYLLLRMGVAQQSLIAVRNEIMQVCAHMPVDGTNVVALEQILGMCEATLASLDRTQVRLNAWKQIYPNHVGTFTSDHLASDDDDWLLFDNDDDDDDDDDCFGDPEDKRRTSPQDECDGSFLPWSFAQHDIHAPDVPLSNHEFALLFGLAQPPQDPSAPVPPLLYDIFGDSLPVPPNPPSLPHPDAPSPSDSPPDPDPDYNVPGSC
ncbi:MAG: hypothetical protein EBS29_02595 [Chloroflexia bacterium]|nr:hypothetical protein [Chloroflexia bacterium]